MITRSHLLALFVSGLLAALPAGCVGSPDDGTDDPIDDPQPDPDPDPTPDPGNATGNEDTTYDHPDSIPDVWDLLDRMQEEGPPEYAARVHSCPKIRYQTIGHLLASRGVDLSTTGEIEAGNMYRTGDQALGAPNYLARSRENTELTTASASKLFDIFIQAAPEVIAEMPNRPECTVGGVGARMFNDFDQCTPDGITCLIGVPASPGHLDLCNEIVTRASTPEVGKQIAVAALMAAAHTCE
jgi:hypothetical protein